MVMLNKQWLPVDVIACMLVYVQLQFSLLVKTYWLYKTYDYAQS